MSLRRLRSPTKGSLAPLLTTVGDQADEMSLGVAFPDALVEHRYGPAKTFRLVVGQVELPGRRTCVGRKFIPLGQAAAEL